MNAPKTITFAEESTLLHYLRNYPGALNSHKLAIRDTCMAVLMLDAGLRVGELVNLRQSHLIFNGHPVLTLHITPDIAKRARERDIPLTARARDYIDSLRADYWHIFAGPPDYYAFYRYHPRTHITARQVQRIISNAARASIGRPLHPHALRHTFATKMRRVTDIRTVQELLGHSNLQSTQIYTHPDMEDKVAAIGAMQQPHSN